MNTKISFTWTVCLFAFVTAYSQDYSISFTGSGASSVVELVKVENLSQGTNLTMNGSEILHLVGTITGLHDLKQDEFKQFNIYPNPMDNESRIKFNLQIDGKTRIKLVDISGRVIFEKQESLLKGMHEYTISGVKSGLYFLSIISGNLQYSGRLISVNPKINAVQISTNLDSDLQVSDNCELKINKKEFKDIKANSSEVLMQYSPGDKIKLTGVSGMYSTVVVDSPTENKNLNFNFIQCTDGDGNNYPIVKIGNQIWMAEDLNTKKYLNGDPINTTEPVNLGIPTDPNSKYQWAYNGNESYASIYGRLYTWYAAVDNRKICPINWHLPSGAEWNILKSFLGNPELDGGMLKEQGTSHWYSPNTGATNEFGFTALPGGWRYESGYFTNVGWTANWWTKDEYGHIYLNCNSSNLMGYGGSPAMGRSARCIHDGEHDLTVTGISCSPTNPTEIDHITITATIKNLGTADCPLSNVSKAYIQIGNESIPVYFDTPQLCLGCTSTINRTIDLFSAGTYSVRVGVDPGNLIPESNEANNELQFDFNIGEYSAETGTVTDFEGNSYKTVKIGTQWWMAENLKSTKYNDGSPITYVTTFGSTPGFCWYNNDESSYKNVYGGLYNWYSINTGKLCPVGWHAPNNSEWTTLQQYLGGESIAGNKLKEAGTIHWLSDSNANNISGFTALPGGLGPSFANLRERGEWWSYESSQQQQIAGGTLNCGHNYPDFWGFMLRNKGYCFSIRCLKDN